MTLPLRRVERGRLRRRRRAVAEDAGVGRVLPVGVGAAAAGVVVGGLDPLVLAREHEAGLALAGGAGALAAVEVVHPLAGLAREPDPVGGVAEGAVGAGCLGEQLAVVERVDEARRAQEVGEAVGLVGPFRRADRVVAAGAGAGREVDLAEPRPGRGALGGAVEVVAVAAHRVDRVEEGDPLLRPSPRAGRARSGSRRRRPCRHSVFRLRRLRRRSGRSRR